MKPAALPDRLGLTDPCRSRDSRCGPACWALAGLKLFGAGAAALWLVSCRPAPAQPQQGVRPAAETPLPPDAVILPGDLAARLLHQCSRQAPSAGGKTWSPSAADILSLESRLPAALMERRASADTDWSKAPAGWRRQYVGIVSDGRRLIYGNYFPVESGQDRWRAEPIVICDGGPAFFGVEYDADSHRIVRMAFNGSV